MSNWKNLELERLSNPDNHKIVSDGYDWRWYNKITGKWKIHSIEVFEDYTKPYSWLQYNLTCWSKELKDRRLQASRKEKVIQDKIYKICQDLERTTFIKVLEIHRLNPELSHKEIGLMIGLSKQMVGRYIKDAA